MTYQGPIQTGLGPAQFLIPTMPPFAVARSIARNVGAVSTSRAYESVNRPAGVAFWLDRTVTVYQLGWLNGSATASNFNVGIFDANWVSQITTGDTARSGVSTYQFVDVADTVLNPGKYFLAWNNSAITANNVNGWTLAGSGLQAGVVGLYEHGSTVTAPLLPTAGNTLSTMAPAAVTVSHVQHCVIALRASPI